MSPLFPQRPPGGPARYHLLAVAVAVIWGTTLISTKILLQNGLTPAEIMFYRFLLAYGVLWLLYLVWFGSGPRWGCPGGVQWAGGTPYSPVG